MINTDEIDAGERIYPGETQLRDIDLTQHVERYNFANRFVTNRSTVLDAACGSGYGASILAGTAAKVVALDISQHALSWAKAHYPNNNIEFQLVNLEQPLKLGEGDFDTVVCFETIEHLKNQELLVKEFNRILNINGRLIISSPNRAFTDIIETENKFHTKEFYAEEFSIFLKKYFPNVELFGQTRVVGLTKSKKVLRNLLKPFIPVIKIVLSALHLKDYVGKSFSEKRDQPSNFEKIAENPEVIYQNLIAVCTK